MKHEILVYNKTRKRIPKDFIESVILRALIFLKVKRPVELAVLVVSRTEIKMLNEVWRKKDEIPDELSFGLNTRKFNTFAKSGKSVLNLGEIVLNAQKISNKKHLSKLLIHSLLHLLGYSHKQMERIEDKI